MIIKVCGMTDAENITAVEHLGVDMIGMVFYPQSPRYVQMVRSRAGSMPDYSRERLDQLQRHLDDGAAPVQKPAHVPRVGVFVDDMPQNIVTRVYNYGLDYVQLHGDESRITCDNLRRTIDPDIRPGLRIIKAIPVADAHDIDRWHEYDGAVDMLLFDTARPLRRRHSLPARWRYRARRCRQGARLPPSPVCRHRPQQQV